MKKIPRKLLVLALLALAGGLGIWLFRERENNPWQPLPKGGEVRLHAVTYGVQHRIQHWVPPLPERVADAMEEQDRRSLAEVLVADLEARDAQEAVVLGQGLAGLPRGPSSVASTR